jgi:site-specific DNA recombinase
VQRLLESEPNRGGRKPVDGDRAARPRLLNGLFWCPTHDRRLYVGGPYGYMMFCKACKETGAGVRPLFTQLNRAVALRLTCRELAGRLRGDEGLAEMIVAACREAAASEGRPAPERLEGLRRQITKAERQIEFLLENLGEVEADRRESGERLRQLRRGRATDAAELAALESPISRSAAIPDGAEVQSLIEDLARILEEAASSGSEDGAARELIELLTGGRIDLEQRGERSAQRGWLRGRFRCDLVGRLASRACGTQAGPGGEGVDVVVDYRDSPLDEGLGERAKALFDEGLLIKEIAARLGASRPQVAKALARWHRSRGLAVPDGRVRLNSLERKRVDRPLFERLAESAQGLRDEGLGVGEIAARLDCDRNTVAKSLAFWDDSRGSAAS